MTEPSATAPAASTPAIPVTTPEQDAITDGLIMACASEEACKVAVLIARTVDAANAQSLEITPSMIAPRIYALAESGKLSVQGNVRRWRAAEIKKGA